MRNAISPAELEVMLKNEATTKVLDVRLTEDLVPVAHKVPGAQWRDPNKVDQWSQQLDPGCRVVVFCVHGLRVSQSVRQELASRGFEALILEGGIDAWQAHAAQME